MSHSTISKRLAQVKPGTLHVGVDLAWDSNVATVIDETAKACARFRFSQDTDGYRYFLEHLEKIRQKQGASQVVIAMEPTNFFWKLLANFLEQKKLPYHLVNAYTVKKHREGDQLDRAKDDPRDSFTIADLSRTGKFTQTRLQHGVYEDLRQYASLYEQLRKNLRREMSILWGLVGQVFPELRGAFQSLGGGTVTALLRTCPAAVSMRGMSEEDFIHQVALSYRGKRVCQAKLHLAYQLAKTSIGLVEGIAANFFAIQVHLNHLEAQQQELLQLIQILKACLQQVDVAPYLLSVKGLNTLSVALILAEIGDPAHYTSGSQLVKLAGIQPTPNSSGRKQRSSTPMSHLGRSGLRCVLYYACLRLVQVDKRFKKLYQTLRTRPHNPLTKMQALGVLMNKLLQVLWALMHKQIIYNPDFVLTA